MPTPFLQQVFAVMAAAPQHAFWLLTKRPARARAFARTLEWPPNVWLGVSVEERKVLHRLEDLRQTPAPVRMLFCEPLLGPLVSLDLTGIGWVTVAGEAGRGARPMDPDWARDLRDQALGAGVPFYFKQWSGVRSRALGSELDDREWNELPRLLVDA